MDDARAAPGCSSSNHAEDHAVGIIRVLDRAVADQIAAGEVVERPASVVKELIENAVDAGASHVRVEVEEAGIARISVIDDGCGMSADDAVLAFSRHATSKLHATSDLLALDSFGFRGEALAAISSVAEVRLLTRPASHEVGTEVVVHHGALHTVHEAGAAVGTRIDVRDLFAHVPARRKFLRSARVETKAIEDVLLAAAVVHPSVSWQFHVDQQLQWSLAAAPEGALLQEPLRIERALAVLGKHVRPWLYPFERNSELLSLRGYVVAPLETKRDASALLLSVNGRPVQDRTLTQAVKTAYRSLLEIGRHPMALLDIGIDKQLVDVNVHPRKAEVRFTDARQVTGHIIALLSDFLIRTPWLNNEPAHTFRMPSQASSATLSDEHRARIRVALAGASPAPALAPPPTRATATHTLFGRGGAVSFSSLRVVGQVGLTYIVCEGPQGMVVIDQHAAHERVLYERLRNARRAPQQQPLLVPLTLSLSRAQLATLGDDNAQALLRGLGFDVEAFGGDQAALRSVPAGIDVSRALEAVRDALDAIEDGRALSDENRFLAACARTACHRALRAGDAMDTEHIRFLLSEMDSIDFAAHCPHGRPVVRTIAQGELASWFHRG
jgi:DNA mismatch repair protein MutL